MEVETLAIIIKQNKKLLGKKWDQDKPKIVGRPKLETIAKETGWEGPRVLAVLKATYPTLAKSTSRSKPMKAMKKNNAQHLKKREPTTPPRKSYLGSPTKSPPLVR